MRAESAAGGAGWAVASMAVFWKGLLTAQESVELDQQSGVGVVRLGSLAVARTDVVVVKIDTHGSVLLVDREDSCRKSRLVVSSK